MLVPRAICKLRYDQAHGTSIGVLGVDVEPGAARAGQNPTQVPPTIAERVSRSLERILIKRSFSLAGHRTSVALEQEFWTALMHIAAPASRP